MPTPRIALIALFLFATACGGAGPPDPVEDFEAAIAELDANVAEPMLGSILTWLNQIGLAQFDPDIWQERLDRTCAQEFWNPEILQQFATEFVAADQSVSVRGENPEPVEIEQAAQALWVMAVDHCRQDLPPGVIEAGPPAP